MYVYVYACVCVYVLQNLCQSHVYILTYSCREKMRAVSLPSLSQNIYLYRVYENKIEQTIHSLPRVHVCMYVARIIM